MDGKFFVGILAAILAQVSGSFETYKGAVVEYHPILERTDGDTTAANVLKYSNYMKEAKEKGAQIIVFPEFGLATKTPSLIPDPADRIAPCDGLFPAEKFVKDLSSASKTNSIYSVVNLVEKRNCEADDSDCPYDGFYTFNTNVVFDRWGTVIARYARYNSIDFQFNQTKNPEVSFFDTDFGVRFGLLSGYDLIFSVPARNLLRQYGITNFVCPMLWYSELPFLTALQIQRGWAESNNVNLFAAGLNKPDRGCSGSGIYNGKYGQIADVLLEKDLSKLIVAEVPKIQNNGRYNPTALRPVSSPLHFATTGKISTDENLLLRKDNMMVYASEVINKGKSERKICRRDLCCDFEVDVDFLKEKSQNYSVRAIVTDTVRYFGNYFRGGVQACGVILCNGPHILNCTDRMQNIEGLFKFNQIAIRGKFNGRNSFLMPSTLTDGKGLNPLSAHQYEFTVEAANRSVQVNLELLWPTTDLRTFGVWGRNFVRDMEFDHPVAAAPAIFSKTAVVWSLIAFLLFLH